MHIFHRSLALVATGAVAALSTHAASAQSVSVTLNGSPVSLVPAPLSRAGRVFVPLRGVFEKLGASVVYSGGTINAQGNGRSVALRIGSTQATVDGQAQMLDVAPFIVGASTYVPLRFVSQALGATVNYDGSNHVVALSRGGSMAQTPSMTLTPAPGGGARSALTLSEVRPARNTTVESRRPTVEAQFAGMTADPNSVRVSLDGLDITNSSSRSASGIVYSPPSDLQSAQHTVRVTGNDSGGMPFDRSWRFTSGTSSVSNIIDQVRPVQGATVGTQFTVSGHTDPNARVVIQVGAVRQQQTAQNVIGQILGLGSGGNDSGASFRSEVNADQNGMFSTSVSINAQSGQQLVLVVDSTEPRSQTAAPRQTRQLVVQ